MEYKQSLLYQMLGIGIISFLGSLLFLSTEPVGVIFPVTIMAVRYLTWKKYKIVIESNKVILSQGILNLSTEHIRIDKVQKIRISRSLIQRMFKNVGTIILETGNDLTIELTNIENYHELYDQLEKLTNEKSS